MNKLNCNKLYEKILSEIKDINSRNKNKPKLVSIRIGEEFSTISYEKNVSNLCNSLGIIYENLSLEKETLEDELKVTLERLNDDVSVDGILLFKPLTRNISENIFNLIDSEKDVDGQNIKNLCKAIYDEDLHNISATPLAIFEYLSSITNLECKNILVINRSNTIGKVLSNLLIKADATVTVAHSKSTNIEELMADKDIIISAVGKSGIWTGEKIKDGSIVFDIGISQDKNGNPCGDFILQGLENKNIDYLPPLQGIGKITTVIMLRNTCINSWRKNDG